MLAERTASVLRFSVSQRKYWKDRIQNLVEPLADVGGLGFEDHCSN